MSTSRREAEWIWATYASGLVDDPLAWLEEQLEHGVSDRQETIRALLCRAVEGGALEAVELLLRRGAPVDGYAMSTAIARGDAACLRRLIDGGGDVDAIGVNGPLLVDTIVADQAELVSLLLDAGADVERPYMIGTPLMWAAFSGRRALVELLLSRGADASAFHDGDTAESVAIQRGHADIAELLRSRIARSRT